MGSPWRLYSQGIRMIHDMPARLRIHAWDHKADLEVEAIIRIVLGSVGAGPVECYATAPEWSIHAFRLITESERDQITPKTRRRRQARGRAENQ